MSEKLFIESMKKYCEDDSYFASGIDQLLYILLYIPHKYFSLKTLVPIFIRFKMIFLKKSLLLQRKKKVNEKKI